ncbi:MAG: hybrid sensor histidine kinase/response regulator [Bacteroidetes bacterium]|nr:hybrid sensor histidine kinase/response regulator [Bacteroidota bacterium]
MNKKNKVVVVDDDFYLLDALNIQLNCEDYDVITLENGIKAFETIKKEQPDCVVLDVMMPGKTGIEVAKELKSDETTKLIPVILLTAKSELDDKLAGFESGIEDYITKPFDFRELNARIKSQIRLYSSIREAYENRYAQKAKLTSDYSLNLISWDSSIHTILFSTTKTLQNQRCLDIFKCHETDCPMRLNGKDEDSQELIINVSGINPVKVLKECKTNPIAGNEITIIDHRSTRDIIDQLVGLNEKLFREATQSEKINKENIWYLTNLNHELKGPLSAIIGYADMINQYQNDEDKSKKYLDIIDKSARNIMSMMMEMMDLARIHSGDLNLHRELLSFTDLFETVLAVLEFNIEQRQVKVITNFDKKLDLIKVDPNRFKQIILNLVSNSVKYNKVGGTIHLTTRLENNQVIVEIEDSGIGIPEENIKLVAGEIEPQNYRDFVPKQGMGFGLKLSRLLVSLHGGSMAIQSVVGSGTKITLSFPKESIIG